MRFLVPAALGVAALAVPLLALYMLRSRRQRTPVSSVYLWDQVGNPVSSAVPWQRLRPTPLLLAQLAILALFALLLARPFFLQETVLGPHTVFVMDTSGSMAMAGRLERAVGEATGLAADVSEANLVSVVDAGPTPRVLVAFSQDGKAVEEALGTLEAGGGVEDLEGALRLARGLETPDRPTRILIFSDGGPADSTLEEPVVGAEHVVFDDVGDNLAITAFSTDPSTAGVPRAFLEVSNVSERARTATVQLEVDGLPIGSSELKLAPMERGRVTVPLEAGPGDVVTARVVQAPDALPGDDLAALVIGAAPEQVVEVTGAPTFFTEALVDAAPGFRPAEGEEDADLLLVDGGDLNSLDRPAWVIRTAEPPDGIEVVELAQNLAVTWQRPGDPLLDGVDLSETVVGEAQVVDAPRWLPLVRSGDVPLVLLGEVGGRRVVYFTFDIAHSNLPIQIAYPILGTRLLEWLSGTGVGGDVAADTAGVPIALVPPPGGSSRVALPDREVRQVGGTVDLFTDTDLPGVYTVTYLRADGSEAPGPVVVRRFAPAESEGATRQIATVAAPGTEVSAGSLVREWAPWVIGGLLLLAMAEWWLGHRRPRRRVTPVARGVEVSDGAPGLVGARRSGR
ncbi:MAG TPA: VWA domain-containing protein [Acidimicrobiia bacterium]|nr:VWA domain-containing protein [Acidimicrobiia bacterium]